MMKNILFAGLLALVSSLVSLLCGYSYETALIIFNVAVYGNLIFFLLLEIRSGIKTPTEKTTKKQLKWRGKIVK